ncbi:MAG: Trm112 family protein [Acidobacteria bacterium]|nr:Trm112 family protein [Acidobacteriota bacterium]
MALKKELLDILVCPLCMTHVQLTPDEKGLKCPACRRVYPINLKDNFPVMLPEEARIEDE